MNRVGKNFEDMKQSDVQIFLMKYRFYIHVLVYKYVLYIS